jgi:hypothetical protein
VSAFHERHGGFMREEIRVGFAAGHGLVLGQTEQRRDKFNLVKQTAPNFAIFSEF